MLAGSAPPMTAYLGEYPGPTRPPAVRTAGRRHRIVIGAIALVIVALTVGDRLLVRAVDHRLAARLACLGTLSDGVSVRVGGFPFLVDAVTGRIPSARVTAGRGGPGGVLTDVTVDLHDLRLPPLTGLPGGGTATKLAVGSATLAATVPLGTVLARLADAPGSRPSLPRAAGGSGLAGGLPFDAHLDGITPGDGGPRVQMSVTGASFNQQAAAHPTCGRS